MEHAHVPESKLLALCRELDVRTIHRASASAVWIFVLMHREVHNGIPFVMYASCNKFTRHDMQDMLHHIYTTWAQSSEVRARGYLLSHGTEGDQQRIAVQRGTMQLLQTADVPGVDCNVAC